MPSAIFLTLSEAQRPVEGRTMPPQPALGCSRHRYGIWPRRGLKSISAGARQPLTGRPTLSVAHSQHDDGVTLDAVADYIRPHRYKLPTANAGHATAIREVAQAIRCGDERGRHACGCGRIKLGKVITNSAQIGERRARQNHSHVGGGSSSRDPHDSSHRRIFSYDKTLPAAKSASASPRAISSARLSAGSKTELTIGALFFMGPL